MRRLNAAITVAAVTAICVLAGAVPASASIVVPPAPVAMTSGAMEAVGGTAVEGGAVVGTTATGAGALVIGAAWAGTTVGNQAAQALQDLYPGWFYTSGSFSCDVTLLVDAGNGCDAANRPDQVTPNADVTAVEPGWNGKPLPAGTSVYGVSAPAYGTKSWPAGAITWSGSGSGSVYYGCVNVTTGANSWSVVGGHDSIGAHRNTTAQSCGTAAVFRGISVGGYAPETGNYWFAEGAPDRPAGVSSDPSRWFTTEWTCADGSTGSAVSTRFHESDAQWPAFPAATCPGSAPVEFEVIESGEGIPDRTVAEWSAPDEYRQWVTGASQQPGELRLYRLDEQSGARLDCFSSTSVCADWWTATTGATTNTDEYQCTYAGAAVELSECTVYAHAFDVGVYSDPATGEAQAVAGDPEPQDDNCPPPFSWAGLFNPWYYYQGGLCAMKAAFVPTTATTTAWTQFRGEVSDHPPVSIAIAGADFTNDVIAGVHGAGDCSTLPLQMADPNVQGPAATFDLCAGVTTAANTTWGNAVELIVTIAIIGTGAWIMAHRIGKSFGSKA